ncbi:MAG TPA: 50S ribosomal protein L4 [Verrucomicrobiales bacterium]|nr:50S ribosomal protein L4 [Verrucomicrobiales bacterium]
MSGTVFSLEDAQSAEIEVATGGKGAYAVHELVTAMRANRRSGTACTKTRAEVSGSGRKIYRQKGTGRARHGEIRAPLFRGGGVAFGPRPRDYSKTVGKKVRRLALRAALGARIEGGEVVGVPEFSVPDGKTRSFLAALDGFGAGAKILVVAARFDESTYLAARNVKPALLMTADEVNVEHLLRYDRIVLTQDALPILARRTRSR